VKVEGSPGGTRGAGAGGSGGAGKRSMMEGTETEPLLGPAPAPRRTRTSQDSKRICLTIALLGLLALVGSITICYFLFFKYVIALRVLSLNVWGMPAKVGSEDKEARIQAIGEFIQKAEYDVYFLAELWMRADHNTIERLLPQGYHISAYGDFALFTCDGRLLPSFCSGLAIVSKFPFVEKQFLEYNWHGDILKLDGEYFARKGAGRARIEPHSGVLC